MTLIAALLAAAPGQRAGSAPAAGPEDFDVKVSVSAKPPAVGTVVVPLTVHVDRYTPEYARTTMTDALKHGGYPGFLRALRDTPRAGYLELDGTKFNIRWAREVADD